MPTLFALLSLVSALGIALSSAIPATVCNGHAELCGRSYSNVTVVGAHDSFAFSSDPFALARDQEVDIPSQLNLGVRLLQAQSHVFLLFDGGTVESYLATVKSWLDANPNEVLTFLFTNPEGQSVSTVWKPAFDAAGITPLAYIPPSVPVKNSDWPTLGELIDSGTRVVVFMDAGADTSSVPFILPEFEMIWETPFSVTDATFPCSVDRTSGPLATSDHSYLINHSLNKNIIPIGSGVIVSDPLDAPTTNSVSSIQANVDGCVPLSGANRNPQFLLLDFVNIGQGFQAADILNGVAS
ncbi:PLC-like phosphodiesterase [Gymnopilus junonius]|uniref:PLC-like phosphodiesterase n=1 Tax=Gymnopilus junonius TaxID=109634 RepID=A0A9P5THH9_GYMJU|nr:PLC-like phosphodiesterase [Gymnopilus junonius]